MINVFRLDVEVLPSPGGALSPSLAVQDEPSLPGGHEAGLGLFEWGLANHRQIIESACRPSTKRRQSPHLWQQLRGFGRGRAGQPSAVSLGPRTRDDAERDSSPCAFDSPIRLGVLKWSLSCGREEDSAQLVTLGGVAGIAFRCSA